MRVFLIIALCVTLAQCKPQYNYPAPATPSGSYGAPGGGSGGLGVGLSTGFGSSSSSFGGGSVGLSGGSGGFSGGSGGFSSGSAFSSGSSGFTSGGGTGGFSGSSGGAGGFVGGGGGTLVQKHIYVHVAPPEPEELRPQRPISVGQSTKHYKIIFIKAPSAPSYQQQLIQQQALNEEKTLVYVLVKKPDEAADITLPTAAPTQPSKPEVYFIRYKSRSEVTGGGGGIATGGHGGISGSGISGGGSSISGGAIGGGSSISGGAIGGGSTFSLSAGDSSSSVSVGRPQTNYGPPGQSGPY